MPSKTIDSLSLSDARDLLIALDLRTLAASGEPTSEANLELMEQYECWDPLVKHLHAVCSGPRRNLNHFRSLARIYNQYLEDTAAAAEVCAKAVELLGLDYHLFAQELLPNVMEAENWLSEAAILQASVDRFQHPSDRIRALERLCLVYEKKIFNESQLNFCYKKLLDSDAHNIKALKYFKLVFTQNQEWEKCVATLRQLLAAVTHKQDRYRYGQELASTLIYQLDRAKEAVSCLDEFCKDSPLDTSLIRYDAFLRLSDWPSCVGVLRTAILDAEDDFGRAILHLKIAKLEELQKHDAEAEQNYRRSIELCSGIFEPLEGLILLFARKGRWHQVLDWLATLEQTTQRIDLKSMINDLSTRISSATSGAKS